MPVMAWSQIIMVGIPQSDDTKSGSPNARTQALQLPFWEDFSTTTTTSANPTRWFAGKSITVTTGMAINPPSIRTATFDGLDSLGTPYNVNDILAKGFADKLQSASIDLSQVAVADRSTVYLSFFYQIKGRGELPDAGDKLTLVLKNSSGKWDQVWTQENDGTLKVDSFYVANIAITDPKYYHADFSFRFQNFARLSGPYDNWHVDYIYLNKGRFANDTSWPDRTISETLTNIFGDYRVMPVTHFLKDPVMTHPVIILNNLRQDQVYAPNASPPVNNTQPVNYKTHAQITYRQNNNVTKLARVLLDTAQAIGGTTGLVANGKRKVTINKLPDVSAVIANSDSIGIKFDFTIATLDNKSVIPVPPEVTGGDYDPSKYSPLDFRNNDSTSTEYLLSHYYAYDDGKAEYGAGLNQPGAQLAYRFDMKGATSEYITHLDLYFPRFGDESSQVIELRIWGAKTATLTDTLLYSEIVSLQRSQNNIFWRQKLTKPTAVGKTFYIGWRQSSAAVIAAGLDKNTNSGGKMYYNVNGTWTRNTSIVGNLMMRPIFGQGANQNPTGLEEPRELSIYPNPTQGSFVIEGQISQLVIYDITGRPVRFASESSEEETRIQLHQPASGMYIVHGIVGERRLTAKIIVAQ